MENVLPLDQKSTTVFQQNDENDKIKLERVIGLTVSTNSSIDVDKTSGIIAYPAGCTIVFHNPTLGTETHLSNICKKSITCLKFSSDGRYLATGESGHQSYVRVWDMTDFTQKAEFSGHKYGIYCVDFSPNQKYLVSIGSEHDMIINVWKWKINLKYASNKISSKIKAIAFFFNGNFITVGNRHVKFWYLQTSRSVSNKEPIPLIGRSAILGELRNNDFIDICCGSGAFKDNSYAITKSGLLCEFNNRRLLAKWIELKTTSANCMVIGKKFIFIGCSEGIVRCFIAGTLQFVTNLPRTHYLGIDIANIQDISHMNVNIPADSKFPDPIALAYDELNMNLTCVYNDHSLYIWDIKNINKIGKLKSFLFHSACIWGVELYPSLNNDFKMPKNSFITCSSDCTIRIWNLHNINFDEQYIYQNNIYSNELLKIIYIDPELNFIKNTELNLIDKDLSLTYDSRNGVRAIRISPDGAHLASGDRSGKIRVHDFKTSNEICSIDAHDAEILYLDYSNYNDKYKLFASASRDRLIHVFNVSEGYNFTQTLDDHSSSITAVKFINSNNKLKMVSCGVDKSIIFRNFDELDNKRQGFIHNHYISGKTTFFDMDLDFEKKHIITACNDRNIRVYNISSGKHTKTFNGTISNFGSLIKVVLDKTGTFLATSCTDKTLCVYNYSNGQCLSTIFGHSELVTGLKFTDDSKYLISASGDGCIFVWHIPWGIIDNKNTQSNNVTTIDTIETENLTHKHCSVEKNINTINCELPLWAKNEISDDISFNNLNVFNNHVNIPKGIWAERSSEHNIFNLSMNQNEVNSIKYDSIDSSSETNRPIYPEFQKESLIIPKTMHRLPPVFDSNNFEDSSEVSPIGEKEINISDIQNIRALTDDSSVSSFKNEVTEINDYDIKNSENEWINTEKMKNPVLYYPCNTGNLANDFTIMQSEINIPKKSQRKSKIINKKDLFLSSGQIELLSNSTSDSYEEDEISTLSIENSDKNSITLSTSNEHLDMIEKHDQFLKNTFESLGEPDNNYRENKNRFFTNLSISSLHKDNHQFNSTIQPDTNIESQSIKRKELQYRILETKKRLHSLGSHSNLKSSQSIYDLSKSPGKFTSKLPVRNKVEKQSNEIPIRKVCSLIDLSTIKSNNDNTYYGFNNSKRIPKITGNVQKDNYAFHSARSNESDFNNSTSESIENIKILKKTNKLPINNSNILHRKIVNFSQSTTALNNIGQNEVQSFPSTTKPRRNSSSLMRSTSEITLNSNKPFEKLKKNSNYMTKSSETLHQKNYLSILTNQLFQTTDKIFNYTNCVDVNSVTKHDTDEVMKKLEQIVDEGFIFSHKNSRITLNKTQEYLDILLDLIKKRLTF